MKIKRRVVFEDISLFEAFSEFITTKVTRGLSELSIKDYRTCFDLFCRELDITQEEPVKIITEQLIDDYITKLLDKGTTVSSVNHYLTSNRVFFYWCMKQGYIEAFDVPLLKQQEKPLQVYTDEQLKILTQKPKTDVNFSTYRSYVIICFILSTGARASTICNIKMEDIDLDRGEVTYRHLKNKHSAIIPLSSSIVRVLRTYIKEWDLKDAEYLFCNVCGQQMKVHTLWDALKVYCERRNVPAYGPHSFRHAFARGWIINGGGAFQLQRMLTHSTLDMTKKYVALFSDDIKTGLEEVCPLNSYTTDNTWKVRRA